MGLLIFFLFAFVAAFTVIMNDREGFQSFGVSMLTGATMTLGEFDFKETFLKDTYEPYSTFYWLRLIHLIAFLVVMPIIIMNLLLALAIDDTNKIMQRAKLQKHIQTVSSAVVAWEQTVPGPRPAEGNTAVEHPAHARLCESKRKMSAKSI